MRPRLSLAALTAALALAATGTLPAVARAQHALAPAAAASTFDPAVPTPRQLLGYEVGERFTPHHRIVRLAERMAATSPRVRLDTLGHTFEGREVVMAIVTSEANHRRMADIRRDAAIVASGAAGADAAAARERLPAIVWLGYTVHGNEASGTEAALALLYQLAAGQDAETRRILDSTVVLIDPVQNPDGHERHVHDVERLRGAQGVASTPGSMVHGGTWPGARTSHYFFDLNRDWFIHSHPETRARVGVFTSWWPHVAVDLHEMGSNSTYFFAPPMEPMNKNVDASIVKWWDVYAAANAAAFDQQGWSYFRREGYDEFYPGYGVSWPILNGAVGMTYEQASSGAGAVRRSDGTLLTLHDAARHHYTAAWATLTTTAARRAERVRDYGEFRASASGESARAPVRAVVFARDAQGRADSLAQRLVANGIAVGRVGAGAEVPNATAFGGTRAAARLPLGGYAVSFAQPQGRLARALLEPDAVLDSAFIAEELESRRTGQPDRFYDVTAWSLPYAYRLQAWTTPAALAGAQPVAAIAEPAVASDGESDGESDGGSGGASPASARYGYAFAPGSEASLRLLAALLADSVRVWYTPRGFRMAHADFRQGAFVVRTAANAAGVHDLVARHARAAGAAVTPLASAAVTEGADLGSNSVFPVRPPRVALLGGAPVNGNSFGFAWYALDQRLGYPSTAVDANAVRNGILRDVDVLVVPNAPAGGLETALGDAGRAQLAAWVRAGGVLVTLDGASGWLATEKLGLSRLRLRTEPADSSGRAAPPASVPGAVVRATTDTLSPLLAGVRDAELPVLVFSDRIYATPRDLRPGEAVIRYAAQPRLRLAGYLWPEVPARLAETPYLWTERVGRGRVIAFAGDPNFRDLWRGLLPLFANAVLLGPSF